MYLQSLHALGRTVEWTWLRFFLRLLFVLHSHDLLETDIYKQLPITLSDLCGIGSSLNLDWYVIIWEQTNFRSFWEKFCRLYVWGVTQAEICWSTEAEGLTKKLNLHGIPCFSPPPDLLLSQGKDKRKTERSPVPLGWSMSQDSKGEMCLEECCFYFESVESQWGQSRNMIAQDGWGAFPSSIPRAKPNIHCFLWIQKTIISLIVSSDLQLHN